MSSIWTDCKKCGDSGPLSVDKVRELKDWGVCCWVCGHYEGPGSYWNYHVGGWEGHCKNMGWSVEAEDE